MGTKPSSHKKCEADGILLTGSLLIVQCLHHLPDSFNKAADLCCQQCFLFRLQILQSLDPAFLERLRQAAEADDPRASFFAE